MSNLIPDTSKLSTGSIQVLKALVLYSVQLGRGHWASSDYAELAPFLPDEAMTADRLAGHLVDLTVKGLIRTDREHNMIHPNAMDVLLFDQWADWATYTARPLLLVNGTVDLADRFDDWDREDADAFELIAAQTAMAILLACRRGIPASDILGRFDSLDGPAVRVMRGQFKYMADLEEFDAYLASAAK